MNEELQRLFNNLIQIERVSTTLYLAMSSYMGRLNYTGIAHVFTQLRNASVNHLAAFERGLARN